MGKRLLLWFNIIIIFVLGEFLTNTSGMCNNPFSQVGEQCLHFGNLDFLNLNYSEALEYCNDIGGHLVMIETPTQFKDIIDYINVNNYKNLYWVDGTDLEQEGKWVFHNNQLVPMGTPFWAVNEHSPGDFFQQPDNSGEEDCLHINIKPFFYLNDLECNFTMKLLCEQSSEFDGKSLIQSENIDNSVPDSSSNCPVPYVPVGDTCLAFMFYTDTMTWPEAVLTCEAMAGTLATIDDPELLRDVYLYLHEHMISEESYWLGGSDIDEEGSWVWLDGSPVPRGPPLWGFTNFIEQPFVNSSINCLGLLSNGFHYFRDDDCEDRNTYKPMCMLQEQLIL